MNAAEWKEESVYRKTRREMAKRHRIYQRRFLRCGTYRVYVTCNEIAAYLKILPGTPPFATRFDMFQYTKKKLMVERGLLAKMAYQQALLAFLPEIRAKWPQYVVEAGTDKQMEDAIVQHQAKAIEGLNDIIDAGQLWADAARAAQGRECTFQASVEWVASMILRPLGDIPLKDAPSPSSLGLLRYALGNEPAFWEKFYARIGPTQRGAQPSVPDEHERSAEAVRRAIEELQ